MPKAVWNGQILAESEATVDVHGTQYFPPDSIKKEYFKPNSKTTVCGWKGTANYYDVSHSETGETVQALAWQYNDTKEAANHFKSYIAFYPPVRVVD
mmetsp:Transcript_6464/g.16547  ORF Transcript_6464/g.16547 Transcript_6464/m.16547 type:complete len:97 (+) Transcript_6464:63-353(+)|eukprot:CAMPEP_0119406168 /NCGR_PEP_ID=MMETSP1335-20130426/600_1 /TAXON_ID=259385 /ORGANISM="Chrysoculter rhomboideus, Strain RCC1486" /LENGTH=96 /DNA_ID=CAMNT_0007430233 /DNA_START=59 /DNA_END=349 /DNA_ORIENTATION=+